MRKRSLLICFFLVRVFLSLTFDHLLFGFFISKYRNPINYLLLNLAISDILFALFIAPKIIVSFNMSHPDGLAGVVLCKLLTGGNIAWVAGVSSVVTLVAIAFERYYSVLYPIAREKNLSRRKLKASLCINPKKPTDSSKCPKSSNPIQNAQFVRQGAVIHQFSHRSI